MRALPQTIYKAAKQTTAKAAQAAARVVREQTRETLQDVKEQTGLKSPESAPPVPEVVQQIREQGPDNINVEQIHAQERSRLAQLEAELARVRQQEEQKKQSYLQTVAQEMQAQNTTAPQETFAPAQGKIRKAMGAAKKKVQSMLTSRKQQESKGGSGKG